MFSYNVEYMEKEYMVPLPDAGTGFRTIGGLDMTHKNPGLETVLTDIFYFDTRKIIALILRWRHLSDNLKKCPDTQNKLMQFSEFLDCSL